MIGTIGQYRLLQRLAEGGMGIVYRARDERLGRQVAVKTLSMDLASDPLALDRFRREARTVAALNHPHICTLHDMVEHDGQAVHRATANAEAYEIYLKGRHYWHQRTPAVLKLAVECFEQAIAADPDFALAYAGITDCYSIYRAYGWLPHAICEPPARAAIERAMALGPELPEVAFAQSRRA
jgi:hypothetical protein